MVKNEENDGKINETEATDIEKQSKKDKRNEQKTNVNEQKTNLDRGKNKNTESSNNDITRYLARARSKSSKRSQPDSPTKGSETPPKKLKGNNGHAE
ncbi:hypothetical protein ElyMa_006919100 [Elysia marginata]|uniref:Uncharacterized protein n=1 Tax=Elysia marginata TaxID=1093978 RepID=A0AAV4JIJ8_9GAST|nr:hypothetical protein ElyMa_006919100 [Elysia marginata]